MQTVRNIPPSSSVELVAPQSWKELTAGQLVYVSWLLTHRQMSKNELYAHAFVRLAGVKVHGDRDGYWLCSCGKRRFTLSPAQALSLCRRFSWLTDTAGEVTPLPRMAGVAHQDPRLRGLPFIQYLACENYYQAFIHTGEERHLNCLIASFYLAGAKFDDSRTASLSENFRGIPFHIRHTAFLWYYGLKSVFHARFPYLFQKTDAADGKPQAPDMRGHINSTVRALTGGDVTKTDDVYRTETWTALAELNAKAREYRELKARINKTNN